MTAVGINQYAPNPFFRNLKYAVDDAEDFAAEIKHQQEHLAKFARVEVMALTDDKATKEKLLGTLRELAAHTQPEDVVVVYFAGHGLAQSGHFYLIPHDIGAGANASLKDEQAVLDALLAHNGISDLE